MILRDYQSKAVAEIRAQVAGADKRLVVYAPTGAGKTEIAIELTRSFLADDMRVAFLADREVLVRQSSERFTGAGVANGIVMAAVKPDPLLPVQVCSSQTLVRRGRIPTCDAVIIDETHTKYDGIFDLLRDDQLVIGLTATPFTRGMAEIFGGTHRIYNVTTTNHLIDAGYLTDVSFYAAERQIDTGKLKVSSQGEWTGQSMSQASIPVVGDIVEEWLSKTGQIFGKHVKTLVFCATIDICNRIAHKFRANGVKALACTSDTGKDDSLAAIAAFRRGEIDVLISCDKFTKGFDVPDVQCLVLARPFRNSFIGHVQQIGRGMRIADGKESCIAIDHAGNYSRFHIKMMTLFENGVGALQEKAKPKEAPDELEDEDKVVKCQHCRFIIVLADATGKPTAIADPDPGWEAGMPYNAGDGLRYDNEGRLRCPDCGGVARKRVVREVSGKVDYKGSISGHWIRGLRQSRATREWFWAELCAWCMEHYKQHPNGEERARKRAWAVFLGLQLPKERGEFYQWQPIQKTPHPEVGEYVIELARQYYRKMS